MLAAPFVFELETTNLRNPPSGDSLKMAPAFLPCAKLNSIRLNILHMKNHFSMHLVAVCIAVFAVLELTLNAQTPAIPGFVVSTYATVTDPIHCAFAPDGTLYTGRDASGSGGTSGQHVSIHRISPGGVTVSEYGPILEDPDAVFFDATGQFSGTPGSVLVGGVSGSGGTIRAILPDFTIVTVAPVSASYGNPGMMRLDRSGRLLFVSTSPEHRESG